MMGAACLAAAVLGTACARTSAPATPVPFSPVPRASWSSQDEVVLAFAPVFVQGRSTRRLDPANGTRYEDFFVALDFDGGWSGFDNWESLADAEQEQRDLRAVVYYDVQETERHYYLHYLFFHPRDPKFLGVHENDLEGAMIVVAKAAAAEQFDARRIVAVQAQAHNRFQHRRGAEVCRASGAGLSGVECGAVSDPARTHVVIAVQSGYGLLPWRHGHGAEIPARTGDFPATRFVYIPSPDGVPGTTTFDDQPTRYALVPLTGDRDGDGQLDATAPFGRTPVPGLWDRRRDVRLFGTGATYTLPTGVLAGGHGIQGDDGCKANAPWGWRGTADGVPRGFFFLDPARGRAAEVLAKYGVVEPPGATYTFNPFLRDSRIAGLHPPALPAPAPLACDCDGMAAAFQASSTGADTLKPGAPCARRIVPESVPAPAGRARWETCDELLEWVHPDARERVSLHGGASGEAACWLRLPADVFLQFPADGPTEGGLRIPGVARPLRWIAVTARAPGTFSLGGYYRQQGRTYDESMVDVPSFAPRALFVDWSTPELDVRTSPHHQPDLPLTFVSLGRSVADTFSAAGALESPEGGEWEVDDIAWRAESPLESAPLPPPVVSAIEPSVVRFDGEVRLTGRNFATDCALNVVHLGGEPQRVVRCTATEIVFTARAPAGPATVEVRTGGGSARAPVPLRVE